MDPVTSIDQLQNITSPKPNWFLTSLLVLLFLSISVFALYLFYQNLQLKKQISSSTINPIVPILPIPSISSGSAPNPTADWKTYTDPEFPVQFKYPSDWEVKDTNYRNFETAVVGTKNAILDEKSPGYLKVSYPFCHELDNPQQRVPCYPSYLDTLNALKFDLAPSSIKEDKIFVDGIEATQITGIIKETLPAAAGSFIKVAVIPLGKYQLFAQIFHQNTESAFDQILSTFTFLVSDEEKAKIEAWIKANNLNQYGDSKDVMYTGGTPLFDERTGEKIERYDYIVSRHPDRPWE